MSSAVNIIPAGTITQFTSTPTIVFNGGLLEATPKVFMGMKRKVIRDIVKLVKPHLRDSGYRKAMDPKQGILGPTRPLKVWTPGKRPDAHRLKSGYLLTEFYAITEDGVMTDAYGHGAVTMAYTDFPIEDLYRLREWLKKRLAKSDG